MANRHALTVGLQHDEQTLLTQALQECEFIVTHCQDCRSTEFLLNSGRFELLVLRCSISGTSELYDRLRIQRNGLYLVGIEEGSSRDASQLLEKGYDDIWMPPLEKNTVKLRIRIARVRLSRSLEEEKKQRNLTILEKALQTMPVGVTVTDADGIIIYTNDADASMHGYEVKELLGRSARLFSPSWHWKWMTDAEMRQIRKWRRESVNVRKDGTFFPVLLFSDVVLDAKHQVIAMVTTCEDITNRKQNEEMLRAHKRDQQELFFNAFHDTLTRLPNKMRFLEQLESTFYQLSDERSFAVFFVDLDYFKLVNDTFGHLVGDQILQAIGERIQSCVRPRDLVARIGGDEFTILLDEIKDRKDATAVSERIQNAFQVPFEVDGRMIQVTGSIGIAFSDNSYRNPEEILRDADLAMYRAKAEGRARSIIFERQS